MSSICRGGFVENTWRKDLCSNCFRTREEHGPEMSSGFYSQPWAHQASPVAIQVKTQPTPTSTPSNYGLPLTPTVSKGLSPTSRYQSPSVGSGINQIGHNQVKSHGGTGRYVSQPPIPRNNVHGSLYSDRVSPGRNVGSGTSNGGINVTVNGTSNSNIKKYVQQHPPQAAIRTSIPNGVGNNTGRVHTNNMVGGGVSVSVGRSLSYGNQLNTVGTGRSPNPINGVGLGHNSGSNYGNPNHGPTNHHHQQRRGTAHHPLLQQPPTHHHQNSQNSPSTKTSSVPVLTQSRNTLQNNQTTKHGQGNNRQNGPTLSRQEIKKMDIPDADSAQVKVRLGQGSTQLRSPKTGKGILRKDGPKRKMSVSFPQEVCAVIGYGGDTSDEESDEEVPFDPLDSSSISEILEKSATSSLEKELNRVTVKNTNFNSIKTNLLGYTSIEIGPIVGGTGGKSKPLVSIGTFEARKEPLRVLRKVGDDSSSSPPKNTKGPITKAVTNLVKSKWSPGSALPGPIRETEKTKTNSGNEPRRNGNLPLRIAPQQQQGISDSHISVQKGRGNEATSPPQEQVLTHSQIVKENSPLPEQQKQAQLNVSLKDTQEVKILTIPIDCSAVDGNIANKRSSFLRDIISPEKTSPVFTTESLEAENRGNREDISPFLSSPHDSLEPPPRVIKSELKLELDPPLPTFQSNKQHYDDDSLEADSGLDTKTTGQTRTSETSESDTEKSGSNSDSGNENDFVQKATSRNGLFVNVDQDPDGNSGRGGQKISKLSPDSVISSEMSSTSPVDSTSASNESIPEKIEEEETLQVTPISKLSNAAIPPVLKRAAPLPPIAFAAQPSSKNEFSEGIYDDVHLSSQNQREMSEEPEESLYDDCETVGAAHNRVVTGSYDFTESGGGLGVDSEFKEGVPLKQHEGIEFLGIRRIDSESFIKQQSPPPQASPEKDSKKTRGGSESPKQKRRVNQFFSTIGKRAGAAFSRSTNQMPMTLDLSPTKNSAKSPTEAGSPFKRSISQDEVSVTRTQELYATLTPTTLKFRGLTPVLNKLSKLELRETKEESAEKKRSKFSNSIKKFLGFGPTKSSIDEGDLENEMRRPTKSPPRISDSPPRQSTTEDYAPSVTRPPPPPPRVHSLDTLTTSGTVSMKPARPPPPRMNQVAPSFISVFAGLEDEEDPEPAIPTHNPPNKPRRKASMCREGGGDNGAYTANYLETTYNHITSLNFETLKLIASQPPAKIKRASNQLLKMSKNPLRWSQFYVTDVDSLAFGKGYAFFSAFWEDEPCVLLVQESLSCGHVPLEFDCIEMSASFEDVVQPQFIPWEPSDFINTGNGVRVYISVLASCTVQKLPDYINNGTISPSRKFYALLQSLDFWGKDDLSNLVVFHKIPTPAETVEEPSSMPNKSKSSPSPNFGLVYVVSTRIKMGANNLLSYNPSRDVYECHIQELMFQASIPILVENDKEILLHRINGSTTEEVEAQLRLFLQLKLFGPRSGDLDKILRYRSERQVTQWMDKERAFCMNDALKRSLERNSEPMSPLRKSFVEFLMISDNCAKTILDFIVDLYPDS